MNKGQKPGKKVATEKNGRGRAQGGNLHSAMAGLPTSRIWTQEIKNEEKPKKI